LVLVVLDDLPPATGNSAATVLRASLDTPNIQQYCFSVTMS
jgi:hypothetical protein